MDVQAAELMQKWAPIDIADALELLSPDFINEEVRRACRFNEAAIIYCFSWLKRALPCSGAFRLMLCIVLQVRGHAVEVLGRADDEELRYYLLQLVQVPRLLSGHQTNWRVLLYTWRRADAMLLFCVSLGRLFDSRRLTTQSFPSS